MSMTMFLHPALPIRHEPGVNLVKIVLHCTVLYSTAEAGIQNPLPVSSTRCSALHSFEWPVASGQQAQRPSFRARDKATSR